MKSRDIIVLAASTGGVDALKQILSSMPADLPASIFVVTHIGAHPSILPAVLQSSCNLPVKHAIDGEEFTVSNVYIAPPDRHLLLYNGTTALSDGPKENFTRPAADPLFRSAAVIYGRRVIGVVLTGDLDDGAAGLRAVRACGGYTLVQDPADCRAPSMPVHALRAAGADVVAPVARLGTAILEALEPSMENAHPRKQDDVSVIEIEERMLRTGQISLSDLEAIGERSALTCPDCGGVIWKIGKSLPLRYRCHTGHAFSAASLESEQRMQSENAIWQVIRGIEERIYLARDQLRQETAVDQEDSALAKRVAALEEARASALGLLKNSRPA
jgi:two-component system chemotaxis response regulator CheB